MHAKYIYPSLLSNFCKIFFHFSNNFSGCPRIFTRPQHKKCISKLINKKYGNCDLDNLQQWTIWKTLNESEHHKSYYQKAGLIHYKRFDTGEKPYKGMAYDKAFNAKSHLIWHQSVHVGEKLYQCKECGRSFNWRSHLMNTRELILEWSPTNVRNVAKF